MHLLLQGRKPCADRRKPFGLRNGTEKIQIHFKSRFLCTKTRHGRGRPWHTDPIYKTCCLKKKSIFLISSNTACLNSSRLQPVLIYHQFACVAAMTFANVITMPASPTGGQQGVIAEDRRPRRAGAQEGTPSSRRQRTVDSAYKKSCGDKVAVDSGKNGCGFEDS